MTQIQSNTLKPSFSVSKLLAILGSIGIGVAILMPLNVQAQQVRTPSFYIFQSPVDAARGDSNENEGSDTGEIPAERPDPLEFINRPIYSFNETLDKIVLKPVARGYDFITPSLVKRGVNNFFQNLKEPGNLLNYALQGKKEEFGNSASRFLTNTTFGLGGIFDIASDAQLPARNTNFGQTLSYYRIAPGPYLVVPFLGPSNLRDTTGLALVDIHTKPQNYLHGQDQTITLVSETVSTRAQYLRATDLVDNAVVGDKYTFVKNAYEQRVRSQDQRTQEEKIEAKNGVKNTSLSSNVNDTADNEGMIKDEERYDLPAK